MLISTDDLAVLFGVQNPRVVVKNCSVYTGLEHLSPSQLEGIMFTCTAE